uniref:Uncharacterized protein n=1 Tax=Oryza punctata TaxID=4537 RepID=A0A0E0M1H8_ORYPU
MANTAGISPHFGFQANCIRRKHWPRSRHATPRPVLSPPLPSPTPSHRHPLRLALLLTLAAGGEDAVCDGAVRAGRGRSLEVEEGMSVARGWEWERSSSAGLSIGDHPPAVVFLTHAVLRGYVCRCDLQFRLSADR